MNYTELSDFEINRRVAERLGLKVVEQSMVNIGKVYVINPHPDVFHQLPEYCNNPADAWPVILEIWDDLSKPYHDDTDNSYWYWYQRTKNISHTRAACEIYLMIKESENE